MPYRFRHYEIKTLGEKYELNEAKSKANFYNLSRSLTIGKINEMSETIENMIQLMGYDPMSELRNKQICKVCGYTGSDCIGHSVRIDVKISIISELSKMILDPICKVFCRCGLYVGNVEPMGLNSLYKAANKVVKACSCDNPIIEAFMTKKTNDDDTKGYVSSHVNDISEISNFLERISSDVLEKFDIDKEKLVNLIQHQIVLLPLAQQAPSIRAEEGGNHTALTKKYKKIIEAIGDKSVRDIIASLVVGNTGTRSGVQSHITYSSGKEGLWRRIASTKRSALTSRAVLLPDITGTGILGVPSFVLENQHSIYVVSPHNIKYLQSEIGFMYVKDKKVDKLVTHFAISSRKKQDISSATEFYDSGIDSSYRKIPAGTVLKYGDRVLKKLSKDDYVVFNRHPTLHDLSLVGYMVRPVQRQLHWSASDECPWAQCRF